MQPNLGELYTATEIVYEISLANELQRIVNGEVSYEEVIGAEEEVLHELDK